MYLVEIADSDETKLSCQRLRYAVYAVEKGWVDPNPQELEEDECDDIAIPIIGVTMDGEPAGTLRLIPQVPGRQLPIEGFGVTVPAGASGVEVSRLAVLEQYRPGGILSFGLYCLAVQEMQRMGTDLIYAIVEQELFDAFKFIGFPFEQLAEPRTYQGGECMPTVCKLADLVPALKEKDATRPHQFGAFFERPFSGLVEKGAFVNGRLA